MFVDAEIGFLLLRTVPRMHVACAIPHNPKLRCLWKVVFWESGTLAN
jgi:hypothetical protein